jgi:hypothetical protein
MIIGNTSLDPRRVTEARIEHVALSVYRLIVEILIGNTISETYIVFTDREDAEAALVKLDKHCHKGQLVDAIATDTLDDDDIDDDEVCKKAGFI